MTFLSYPKYYTDETGGLRETVTTLVPADDPNWDYQVTTGIWHLYVRNDGYFQAQHKGDVFTYRFADLGYGTGDAFQPVDLGKPDFSRPVVSGDTIRWNKVFADVDVTVRYIHDIMKVDVILKREFMRDLRAVVSDGSLSRDAFLTARFDIDLVEINSEARQGGAARDLFAPSLALDTPLEFVQDGKVVHKLRPVEAYVLDDAGNEIVETASAVRTNQVWRLRRNALGMAEMSAHVGDLTDLPDGVVVIDPSTIFSPGSQDTVIKHNSAIVLGSSINAMWQNLSSQSDSDHPLFAFDVSALQNAPTILNPLELHVRTGVVTIGPGIRAQAFKVTKDWNENANWFDTGCCGSWGTWYDPNSYSPVVTLPTTSNQWLVFNVLSPFASHYFFGSPDDVKTKGFMLDMLDQTSGYVDLFLQEHPTVEWRPKLKVTFKAPKHGGDVGNGLDSILTTGQRIQDGKEDQLQILRYFASEQLSRNQNFVANAHSRNMEVLMTFPASGQCLGLDPGQPHNTDASPSGYTGWINYRLTQIEANTPGALGKTVTVIQLGNEEDNFNGHNGGGNDAYFAGWDYANYYVAAHDLIKQKWPFLEIMAGSFENSNSLGFVVGDTPKLASPPEVPPQYQKLDNGKAAVAFFNGFIQHTIVLSGGTKDKLPNQLSVHGYPASFPPELIQDESPMGGTKDWTHRQSLLEDITFFYGYFPLFSVTEYGFSPKLGKLHAPMDVANVRTQAVYFMRRTIMDTCLRGETLGSAWDYTTYWQHAYNPDNPDSPGLQGNTGWYSDWTQTEAERRIIVDVARKLYAPPAISGDDPGLQGTESWAAVPFSEERNIGMDEDETIRCGWINLAGQKWGAIWRFENTAVPPPPDPAILTSYYVPPTAELRTFTVQGENPGTADLYKFLNFSFTDPIGFGTAQWVFLGSINGVPSGNDTVYTLPATIDPPDPAIGVVRVVDENPVFIKF